MSLIFDKYPLSTCLNLKSLQDHSEQSQVPPIITGTTMVGDFHILWTLILRSIVIFFSLFNNLVKFLINLKSIRSSTVAGTHCNIVKKYSLSTNAVLFKILYVTQFKILYIIIKSI